MAKRRSRVIRAVRLGAQIDNWQAAMQENLDSDGVMVIGSTFTLQIGDVLNGDPPLRITGPATQLEFQQQMDRSAKHAKAGEEITLEHVPEGLKFYRTEVAD